MKKFLYGLCTLLIVCLLSSQSFASSLIGFSTEVPQYYTIYPSGTQMQINFGGMRVTNAFHNGSLVSGLSGAEVRMADVFIDLDSKQILGTIGSHDLVYYQLSPHLAITDGFQIVLDGDVLFSGDMLLYDLYLYAQTGSVDSEIQYNVINPTIHASDPELVALFNDFVEGEGGDLNITLEDIHNLDIAQRIAELTSVEGLVGGTFSSMKSFDVPEPISVLLFTLSLIGMLGKRNKQRR